MIERKKIQEERPFGEGSWNPDVPGCENCSSCPPYEEDRGSGVTKRAPKGSLEQRVLRLVREERLLAPGEVMLVGISGGSDSVCLLHILAQLQEELGIRVRGVHLNHQLRGAESEADAQYVRKLCQHLGIPVVVESRDVAAYQRQYHCSLEEAAREVRYSLFAAIARSVGASQVAVGHTRDDHVETILLHLIRGAGARGLRGLQPKVVWKSLSGGDSLVVVRPLLGITREETANYCQQRQLTPRLDSSNESLSPLRNRIRLELLPLLRSYNPNIDQVLLRTASLTADDFAFLEEETSSLWAEVAIEEEGTIFMNRKRISHLSPALQRQLLRRALERLLGSLHDIRSDHIEEMRLALTKAAGKRLSLPGGLFLSTEYERCLLGPDPAYSCPFPVVEGECALKAPGETMVAGWQVKATVGSPEELCPSENALTAYFDLDKADSQLMVRTRRPGDRFYPLGMSQPKKIQDFMVDAKIPAAWRERVPLVCSLQQILWVVGWRIDERVKITPTTKRVLRLEFGRLPLWQQ